jgi:hypothetical protein
MTEDSQNSQIKNIYMEVGQNPKFSAPILEDRNDAEKKIKRERTERDRKREREKRQI